MYNESKLKDLVKEKYAAIAGQAKDQNTASCCGATTSCCGAEVYNIMTDDYAQIEGYNPDADLGLGCGLPTEFAQIKEGDVVIDLGSGAGNDCFIARKFTGERGKVIGIDFTPAMIARARENTEKLGLNNVEFRQGDIDEMPVTSNYADVVVSNCVLNLVPDKLKVFKEINRVLKLGGHFSISDIVLDGELPPKWKEVAELYAGCVSGAIQKDSYLAMISSTGFQNLVLQKDKPIYIPDEILNNYLSPEEVIEFRDSKTQITSITVYAEKPLPQIACCVPGDGCC